MIFGGLAMLLGGFLSQVLAWLAVAVGASLASISGYLTLSTVAMLVVAGPWLTMPWIPWIALGQCIVAFITAWVASLGISFVVKFGVPLVTMGWIKP